jgi:hypothetical protein
METIKLTPRPNARLSCSQSVLLEGRTYKLATAATVKIIDRDGHILAVSANGRIKTISTAISNMMAHRPVGYLAPATIVLEDAEGDAWMTSIHIRKRGKAGDGEAQG